jgi:hypothetical protein
LPWFVLGLVPLVFLAGFGIVHALAGGGEDAPEARVATQPPTTVAAVPGTEPEAGSEPALPTTAPATTAPPPTVAPPTTTAPAESPREGRIEIDYGRWQGMFVVTGATLVPSLQGSTVGGQFTYRGGATCPIGNVVVEGRFYDREEVPIGVAHWESSWVTGDGGLEEGRPVSFGAYGNVFRLATAAELEVVRVVCAR